MDMKNPVNGPDIPMGLGMALAQNKLAMEAFSTMTPVQQQAVIDHTHSIQSKKEMKAYVASFAKDNIGS